MLCTLRLPFNSFNLTQNLYEPHINNDYDLSIAFVEGKYQPTFFMARKTLKSSLGKFIDLGGRKIMHWIKQTNFKKVVFTNPNDFINLNSKTIYKTSKKYLRKLSRW